MYRNICSKHSREIVDKTCYNRFFVENFLSLKLLHRMKLRHALSYNAVDKDPETSTGLLSWPSIPVFSLVSSPKNDDLLFNGNDRRISASSVYFTTIFYKGNLQVFTFGWRLTNLLNFKSSVPFGPL